MNKKIFIYSDKIQKEYIKSVLGDILSMQDELDNIMLECKNVSDDEIWYLIMRRYKELNHRIMHLYIKWTETIATADNLDEIVNDNDNITLCKNYIINYDSNRTIIENINKLWLKLIRNKIINFNYISKEKEKV